MLANCVTTGEIVKLALQFLRSLPIPEHVREAIDVILKFGDALCPNAKVEKGDTPGASFEALVKEQLTWRPNMKSPELDNRLAVADEAYQHFSWTIWHEGVRAFDQGYPGAIRDINTVRQEAIQRQAHNPHAQDLIRAASNEQLVQFVYQTRARVYSEFQLVANFQWVAYHEGQRDQFRNLLSQRNFNAIRTRGLLRDRQTSESLCQQPIDLGVLAN